MNTATKQRLVGTIVLGALALILIPLLLDGEGVEPPPAAISVTMPPAPVIAITPLPQPQRPVILADSTALIDPPETEPAADAATAIGATDTAPSATAAVNTTPDSAAAEPAAAQSAPAVDAAAAPPAIADLREPQLDQQGLPVAWSVQLGMFGDRANAEALLAQLLLANYKAYLRPQGRLNGVFVGPVMTRAEANTLRQQLAAELDLDDAIVTQFEIEPLQ